MDLCFQAGKRRWPGASSASGWKQSGRPDRSPALREETRARYAALEHTIAEQREQLTAVVQQLNILLAARQRQEGDPATYPAGYSGATVTDDEVEVAFLEEQRRRTGPTPDPLTVQARKWQGEV